MVSFERIFPGEKVRVVAATVDGVDFDARVVKAGTVSFPYDYLILGTGSETEDFGVPGIEEHALKLWSLDDALEVRERVSASFLAASREADAEKRKALLTFAVAGAGFTGVELAGEFAEYRDAMCERYHLDRSESRVVIVEALPDILTMIDPGLRAKAKKLLAKLGVELMLEFPHRRCGRGARQDQGRERPPGRDLRLDLRISGLGLRGQPRLDQGALHEPSVPPFQGRDMFEEDLRIQDRSGTAPSSRESAGVSCVDRFLRSVDYDNVYVVGDAPWFLEGGKPLPQIVETSVQTAERAARNIAAAVTGRGEAEPFKSDYHGFMVSIGSRYAVQNLTPAQVPPALDRRPRPGRSPLP